MLLDILGIRGASDGSGDTPLPGNRLRLTPLGRHGLREYLLAEIGATGRPPSNPSTPAPDWKPTRPCVG